MNRPDPSNIISLNATTFNGEFKGIITVNGQLIQLSIKDETVTYHWDNEKSLFTIYVNLKRRYKGGPRPKEVYHIFANIWLKDCQGCKTTTCQTVKNYEAGTEKKICNKGGSILFFFECNNCDQTSTAGRPIPSN